MWPSPVVPAPVGLLGGPLLTVLGGWTVELQGCKESSRRLWLPEGPQAPPEHGCTNAAGGAVCVECSQRGLGGNTIKDNERIKEKRKKQEDID